MNKIKDLLDSKHLTKYSIVDWGYTNEAIPKTLQKYNKWVNEGLHGPLTYLDGERKEKRQSLKNYYPEFESAIVFLFSYSKYKFLLDEFYKDKSISNGLKIAGYVLGFGGIDYHFNVRDSLNELADSFRAIHPDIEIKHSLDTQPILERDMAVRSGLGWFGKNSMLISKKHGSFLMLGSLLFSKELDLELSNEEVDHCGQCTRCIVACPTDAISQDGRSIDSNKCISTYTIELFKDVSAPPLGMDTSNGEVFGCDICQEVCPWNKRLLRVNPVDKTINLEDTKERKKVFNFFLKRPLENIQEDLEGMSNRQYQREFFGTAMQRTGRQGLLKNIKFYLKRKK